MSIISWSDFEAIDLRVGTIISAKEFPEAKKPAFKLVIDLGPEVGHKQSSAQITQLYSIDTLVGQQVICVCNFPPKQIGSFRSEVLVTGLYTATGVVLVQPQRLIQNGLRLG